MKALIIEDEAPAVRRLKKLVEELSVNVEVVGEIDTVQGAIEWFENNEQPDFIFSDIQLADGKSFEIYQQVEVSCPIIFTTAYDEYAIKAFELNSIGYLLKPFKAEDIEVSLKKIKTTNEEENFEQIHHLINSFKNQKEYKSRFLIHKGESMIPIETGDIAYFQTKDKAVWLITKEKQSFLMSQNLDELEHSLDPKQFFRLNRQFIANYKSIERVENHFNGKLKVYIKPKVEEELMISRLKAGLFKKWLDQ